MTTLGAGGPLEVDVSPEGARLTAMRVLLPDGSRRDVLVGRPDEDFAGATVGRYANRIAGASFDLDGTRYRLSANEGGNTLHGGADGFDRRRWEVVAGDAGQVELRLVSPDGDQGFPGTVTVRARFEVEGRVLRTTYAAVTDAPTHVSLSSHPYFDLDGRGEVGEHRLTVLADRFLPVADGGLPTGELRPVRGTPFELAGARLADALAAADPQVRAASGIDHAFVLRGSGTRTAAVLEGRDLRLTLATDQPALQVFTGAGGRVAGIALEPEHLPDSPHHPQWPSTVLRPGERYRWSSTLTVAEP